MINYIAKFIFRNIVFPTLYYLGLIHILNKSGNKLLIITYHGVTSSRNLKYNGRHFSKKSFERHIKYMIKYFDVISLSDIFKMYKQNQKPKRQSIAITFDDGFENNYTFVYPILKKYNIPATFFISAICIENNNAILWPDVINILRQSDVNIINANNITFSKGINRYDYVNTESNLSLLDFLKNQKSEYHDKLIEFIKDKYHFDDILKNVETEIWKLMSKKQITELAASNLVEIGSHGYLHYNLANIEEYKALEELKKSKELIESLINKEVISIAYPDSSYNNKIKKLSLDTGYKNLCAVTYQEQEDANDKNILPRYGMSSTTNYYSNIFFLHKAFKHLGF